MDTPYTKEDKMNKAISDAKEQIKKINKDENKTDDEKSAEIKKIKEQISKDFGIDISKLSEI